MSHNTRRPLTSCNEAPRYTEDAAALEQLFRERPDPWDFFTDPYEVARLRTGRTGSGQAKMSNGQGNV